MSRTLNIGILAVQGAFQEHGDMVRNLGAEYFLIRRLGDLQHPMDGLILPGGESTVQGKLLRELGLFEPLREKILGGLPVFGTCAGMILLAKKLYEDPVSHFGCMDITVKRNAYGRQLGSFLTRAPFGNLGEISMPFIRAPYVAEAGEKVEVLGEVDGKIVAVREKNMLAISFHPEVTEETAVHRYFLDLVEKSL